MTTERELTKPSQDRREFLARMTAAGFALAVQPVHAALQTPAEGLSCGMQQISTPTGALPVYAARPSQAHGPLPVVLVVQEIFGVHEYIKDVCRRLAHAGYLAIAPELYFRQGNAAQYSDIQTLISELVSKVPDAQVLDDLDRCLAWSHSQGGDPQRAGITGFCWGGRVTWLYALHNPALKAGVAWYGKLNAAPGANTPQQPLALANTLQVPVLGLYGARDESIPLADIAAMQDRLAQGHSGSSFVVYPDAGHAFHADYRPSYRVADAEDGWKRLLGWFAGHGLAAHS